MKDNYPPLQGEHRAAPTQFELAVGNVVTAFVQSTDITVPELLGVLSLVSHKVALDWDKLQHEG